MPLKVPMIDVVLPSGQKPRDNDVVSRAPRHAIGGPPGRNSRFAGRVGHRHRDWRFEEFGSWRNPPL